VHFRILGPIEVVGHDDAVVPIGAPRDLAVLGALLLNAGQVVSRAYLTEVVWGEDPPRTARDQLYTCVSRLRKLLGSRTSASIGTLASGYSLTVAPDQIDRLVYDRAVRAARAARDDHQCDAAVQHFRRAERLWRGDALDGVDSDVLRRAATLLNEERVSALEDCIDIEIQIGRARQVVPELVELIGRYPLRERLHAALMWALSHDGRQGEALEAYRRLYRMLQDELGIEPSRQIVELHQRILGGEAGGSTTGRDLDRPVTTAGTRPAPQRQAVASHPPPRELPFDVPNFTARHDELARLDALLPGPDTAGSTLVVITGTAGVGKSALAVHWAHRIGARFPDGQLVVDLRGFAGQAPLEPVQALSTLLLSLGVPPGRIPAEETPAAKLYRTLLADRRVLILLDDAGSAAQVRPLLPGAGTSLVLVTSRDRLSGLVSRDGAHRLFLDVFSTEDARSLLSRMLGPEPVRAEPAAAEQLSRLCGHLPLALRVAAANLVDRAQRSIAGYVDELSASHPLDHLANDGDDPAVRTAFDLSYRALPAEARRMFRFLGVIAGPDITVPAAAVLAGTTADTARARLDHLARTSLVGEHQPGRYRPHELLRAYAVALTATEDPEDERRAAVQRLVGWYFSVADAAATTLYPETLRLTHGPPTPGPVVDVGQPGKARSWLEAERLNLVAAVEQAAGMGLPSLAWHLAFRLRRFFWSGGHPAEWQTVADKALAAATADGSPQGQVTARLSLGDLYSVLSRHRDAAEQYHTAAALAREAGWAAGEGACLGAVGARYLMAGRLGPAEEALTRRLVLARQERRPGVLAATLGNLANIYREGGRLDEAIHLHEEALVLYRDLGATPESAGALSNLGDLAHLRGRLGEAAGHLTRAITLSREVGSRMAEIHAALCLAGVHRDAGRRASAMKVATEAVAMAGATGGPQVAIRALNMLASIHVFAGRAAKGLEHHHNALHQAQQADHVGYQAVSHAGLAEAYLLRSEAERASWHAEQALAYARESGFRLPTGEAFSVLSGVAHRAGDHAAAERNARAALQEHRATGHRLGEARALLELGLVLRDSGDGTNGDKCCDEAVQLYRDMGAQPPEHLRERWGGWNPP
jgi:DNA-binding SARP family transcriptional activator/tetratricopeptide (TPR) repeat protein